MNGIDDYLIHLENKLMENEDENNLIESDTGWLYATASIMQDGILPRNDSDFQFVESDEFYQ